MVEPVRLQGTTMVSLAAVTLGLLGLIVRHQVGHNIKKVKAKYCNTTSHVLLS